MKPGRYEQLAQAIEAGSSGEIIAAAREEPPAIVVSFPDGKQITLLPFDRRET